MAYSQKNGLKTLYSRPVYHNGTLRTQFRLPPDLTYASNLRLTGLGAVLPAGTAPTNANAAIGILAGIRHIYLYQNGKLLDQRREFNRWAVFQEALRRTNQSNVNLGRSMYLNTYGFQIDEAAGIVTPAAPEPNVLTDDAATTSAGVLYLKDVFGLLQAVALLPPSMESLEVVIEWEMREDTIVADGPGVVENYLEPTLVADYSDDPRVAEVAEKTLEKGVVYDTQLHDAAYIPAAPVTAGNPEPEQTVTIQPRGFEDSTVRRLLVASEPTDGIPEGLGRLASSGRWRGRDIFTVNGTNIQGWEGLDNDARRLTSLVDTFGEVCTAPGFDAPGGVPDEANHISQRTEDFLGNLAFTGVPIGQKIADIQHNWRRTGCFNAAAPGTQDEELANRPLTLHYFADTQRFRTKDGTILSL